MESHFGHITFVEIDHEIVSTVIPHILLVQERQLSFTGESICTSTGEQLRRKKNNSCVPAYMLKKKIIGR